MGSRLPRWSSTTPTRRKKEFAISVDGIYRPWEKIRKELESCVMLCANCHPEIHAGVRSLGLTLGSVSASPTAIARGDHLAEAASIAPGRRAVAWKTSGR